MTYSPGLLNKRIMIQKYGGAQKGKFGIGSGGPDYQDVREVFADVSHVKGVRAMNEGSLDVYGVVNIRCYYDSVRDCIDVRSRIKYQGQTYQILGETLHIDEMENTCEMKAQVIINTTNTPLSDSGLTSPGLNPEI